MDPVEFQSKVEAEAKRVSGELLDRDPELRRTALLVNGSRQAVEHLLILAFLDGGVFMYNEVGELLRPVARTMGLDLGRLDRVTDHAD